MRSHVRSQHSLYIVVCMSLLECSFGLCNAPRHFSTSDASDIIRLRMGQLFCVYIDDILIASNTFEEHLKHLRERLRKALLRLKPKKCLLLRKEVPYLGHVVLQLRSGQILARWRRCNTIPFLLMLRKWDSSWVWPRTIENSFLSLPKLHTHFQEECGLSMDCWLWCCLTSWSYSSCFVLPMFWIRSRIYSWDWCQWSWFGCHTPAEQGRSCSSNCTCLSYIGPPWRFQSWKH